MLTVQKHSYERALRVKYMAKKADVRVYCECCMQEYCLGSWMDRLVHSLTCKAVYLTLRSMNLFAQVVLKAKH